MSKRVMPCFLERGSYKSLLRHRKKKLLLKSPRDVSKLLTCPFPSFLTAHKELSKVSTDLFKILAKKLGQYVFREKF